MLASCPNAIAIAWKGLPLDDDRGHLLDHRRWNGADRSDRPGGRDRDCHLAVGGLILLVFKSKPDKATMDFCAVRRSRFPTDPWLGQTVDRRKV